VLSPIALQNAQRIDEQLKERGIVLRVLPETPLAAILETCAPVSQAEIAMEDSMYIESVTNGEDVRALNHDDTLNHEIENFKARLQAQLKFSKDVVNPQIRAVYEAVSADVKEVPMTPYVIVECCPADVFQNDTLHELIRPVATRTYQPGTAMAMGFKNFPARSEDELKALIATGSGVLDDTVLEHVAAQGADFLTSVYNKYFVSGDIVNCLALNQVNVSEMLVLFLMARNLVDETPAEGVASTMAQYTNQMVDLFSAAAYYCIAEIERQDIHAKSDRVVINFPAAANAEGQLVIEVSARHYEDYLANGGSADAIIGSALSTQVRDSNELLAQNETLTRTFLANEKTRITQSEDQMGQRLRESISNVMRRVCHEAQEQDVVLANVGEGSLEENLLRHLNEALAMFSDYDLIKRPYFAVQQIVCHTLYNGSDALEFIRAIDAFAEKYPDDDVRKNAYRALVAKVCAFVAGMFTATLE
jgi:hypothetical protein